METAEQGTKKPELLKVLLILTFIGSGLTLFSNFFLFAFFPQFKAVMANQGTLTFMGSKMNLTPFFQVSRFFYLVQAFLSGLSFAGAFYMWNLKKIGFHFYTSAQLGLLIVPSLFIRGLPFPGMEFLISFLFVFMYFRFLKIMR